MNKKGGIFLIVFAVLWMLILAPMCVGVFQSGNADLVTTLFFVPFILVGIGTFVGGIVSLVRKEKAPEGEGGGEQIPLVYLMPDGQIGIAGSNRVEITAEISNNGYSTGVSILQDRSVNFVRLENQTQITIGIRKNV